MLAVALVVEVGVLLLIWARWREPIDRCWRRMVDILAGREPIGAKSDERTSLERETADQCEHRDAAAEPIEADVDGDGETDIIGWLCSVCGAKVSLTGAIRRNRPKGLPEPEEHAHDTVFGLKPKLPTPTLVSMKTEMLRGLLVQKSDELDAIVESFRDETGHGEWIITKTQHDEYERAAAEAAEIRDAIKVVEQQEKVRADLYPQCSGYVEVAGMSPGSVTRRYARSGECLCGECPDVEVEEIRAHGGELVRTVVTPALPSRERFEEPVDLLEQIVRGVDAPDIVRER